MAYYRLIGYENRDICQRLWLRHSLDFCNDTVDAGEIGAAKLVRHSVLAGWAAFNEAKFE